MAQEQYIATRQEITDAMIEAGAEVVRMWHSEPGEPIEWMMQHRRCAEEVFMAMAAAHGDDESSQKEPAFG